MSHDHQEDEDVQSNREFGVLSEDEFVAIQEEYRKKKLFESLIGWGVSTMVHAIALVLIAVFCVSTVIEKSPEVAIAPKVVEEPPKVEPPPPPPPPVPPPENPNFTSTDVSQTSVATPDAPDAPGAFEDVDDAPPSTNDNAMTDLVCDVKMNDSPFVSSKIFGGRSAHGRKGALAIYGGNPGAQDKLDKALAWLAKVQNPDGSWGTGGNTNGLTGLALLTFLAHGETPISKSYGKTVETAITFLAAGGKNDGHEYGHAIKTYALCEAYAMTMQYDLLNACNTNVDKIIKGQQAGGSFDYKYSTDEGRQDLSYAGWNFQALKAAKGAGIQHPGLEPAIQKAVAWLKKFGQANKYCYSCQNNDPTSGGKLSRQALYDSIGCLCLQLYGEGGAPEIKEEIRDIADKELKAFDWKNAPSESLYGWYYATQVMFQAGGNDWKAWNRVFQNILKDNMNPEGYWEYPSNFHGKTIMSDLEQRIYATTFCGLMLTVYYRYLPSGKGAAGHNDKPANGDAKGEQKQEFDILN